MTALAVTSVQGLSYTNVSTETPFHDIRDMVKVAVLMERLDCLTVQLRQLRT